MYDNRIISNSEYNVTSVNRVTTADNNLTKRSYIKTPLSNNKKRSNSKSFDNDLHSAVSHTLSNDNSATFSNELENELRLKSEENSRLVQSKFKQNTLNDSDSKQNSDSNQNTNETELHNKLSEAMDVEVDVSDIYKKIELLHSLK